MFIGKSSLKKCFGIKKICSIFVGGWMSSVAKSKFLLVIIIAFAVYSKNVQETWRWKECIHE